MPSEIQYPFAIDESNNLVFIKDVNDEQRYIHSYYCPGCNGGMRPRLGKHNEWHFYHSDNHKCNVESYIHKTAKIILKERFNDKERSLFIVCKPLRPCMNSNTCKEDKSNCWIVPKLQTYNLSFYYDLPAETEVDIIEADGITHFRPDVLLRSSDVKREVIFIEVFYKHKSTVTKIASGRRIIEIRVRSLTDLESLKTIDKLEECEDISFYNFSIPSFPEQIAKYLVDYARECGVELLPSGLPPCMNNTSSVNKYLKCPKCGGKLILRNGRLGQFYGCSNYPKCKYTAN